MKASQPAPVARPRLVVSAPSHRPNLGDMLQRLALIAPNDLYQIARLVADVLQHAEVDHKRFFPRDNNSA